MLVGRSDAVMLRSINATQRGCGVVFICVHQSMYAGEATVWLADDFHLRSACLGLPTAADFAWSLWDSSETAACAKRGSSRM